MECLRGYNMTKNHGKKKSQSSATVVVVAILAAVLLIFGGSYLGARLKCEGADGVFGEKTLFSCRDMTILELFDKKCTNPVIVGEKSFTCKDVANRGLQEAYLNNDKKLTIHKNMLYELGTAEENEAGKNAGDYCLMAIDTWSHIGEKRCVALNYKWIACASGHCYLDEKKDYENGFVAYFPTNYSWDSFYGAFKNQSGPILICGVIQNYQGHPQITVSDPSSQIVRNPTIYLYGSYMVYKWTCN